MRAGGVPSAHLFIRLPDCHSSVRRLLRRTAPVGRPGLWYVGEQELAGGEASGKMDHLVCFLPGAEAVWECGCQPACLPSLLHQTGRWVMLGAG